MRYTFIAEQTLPHPLETVFAFFANPQNLPRLMPPWQDARIDEATFTPPPPLPAGAPPFRGQAAGNGSRILLTLRPFPLSPVRLRWEALIEDFRWYEGFCDTQGAGPFRYWRHCHSLRAAEPTAAGQPTTTVRDHVTYELPLGPLSPLANALFIRHQLAYNFRFRQQKTLKLLASLH